MTVINYWDAKVATFELSEAGMIVGECDMETMPGAEYVAEKNPDRVEHWQYRQRWPHTHCAKTEPYNNRRIFVCDLGRDKAWLWARAGPHIHPTHTHTHTHTRLGWLLRTLDDGLLEPP